MASTGSLIVFDLDGTLIDSRLDLAESVNELLTTYGADARPIDEISGMVGDGARMLVERGLDAAGLTVDVSAALTRFLEIYDRRLLNHTRLYDGIADLVRDAAARATLAVLTNKPLAPTAKLMHAFDLAPHFRWVVGGDGPFPRKPDPSGLRDLIARADVVPSCALMVGDSLIDLETGRGAGTRVCAAMYGFGHLRSGLTIGDDEWLASVPGDLPQIVEEFFASTRRISASMASPIRR
jgi:phosphoglycolate phosphatase